MKKLILLFSVIFLSACSLNSSLSNQPTPTMTPQTPITASPSAKISPTTDAIIGLKTKNGQIVIKLYKDQTPNTVATFLKKVNSGFYNGLTFHRVIAGFMAQGGDPTGTGTGGGSQKSELNQIPFKRGSLGLARTPATKEISNDSQFFICFTDDGCQHLTGDYVNFGEVISGFDILDQIQQGDKIIEITTKTK
ncbi:MAG: peptidylprolyl isomerase [Candidatus Shapirobacteria bacterium]|jgi:peptidylprolyl isomerase